MPGYLALILHAHLPFVRHPEHEHFLEEHWLFEAITESYIPLLQGLEGWRRDEIQARVTLTISPTLCSMLQDALLQARYRRYLDNILVLCEKETFRTHWEPACNRLAAFYVERLQTIRQYYHACAGDLVSAFRRLQDENRLEIITCAATHSVLPLLANHPPSIRAQILVARDHYRTCFGRDPIGIWLPECAYVEGLEHYLLEAGLRWFVTDSHALLHAQPKPRYAYFAPVFTPSGPAAFARDHDSAKQVWSRHEGYPGDPHYRDFYRDIGFDLDLDYLQAHLPVPGTRSFTGIKYHRITGGKGHKEIYHREAALGRVKEHAAHFFNARVEQIRKLNGILDRTPLILAPYDAELFGHWWYEGPEFLDAFVRHAHGSRGDLELITPTDYLRRHPENQVATPAPSSWGEEGYWRVWLNEKNEWVYRYLQGAQQGMTQLAQAFPAPTPLQERALKQAGRELLLAQASDWPFILRTGTSPDYAHRRLSEHLRRFHTLQEQLRAGNVEHEPLERMEREDNIFPQINFTYWR